MPSRSFSAVASDGGGRSAGCGRTATTAVLLALCWLAPAAAEHAVRLKSGLLVRGSVIEVPGLNQNAFSASGNSPDARSLSVWMIDDGLRRTYLHKHGMVAESNPVEDLAQRIEFWQPAVASGRSVAGLGAIMATSPFNDYGQRAVTLRGPNSSPIAIIQGITEINARFAKVEALRGENSYLWQSRVATSAIPTDQLTRLFARRIDRDDYGKRLEVVRLYIEAERFGDARRELQVMVRDFPDEPRLATQIKVLAQRQASQLLDEAKLRREAGQEQLAMELLETFPTDDAARVTVIEVQDMIEAMRGRQQQGQRLVAQLRDQIAALGEAFPQQPLLELADEIEAGISNDTLRRLSDYVQLGGNDDLPLENRVALAVGGWLLGSGSGMQNLTIGASLLEIRHEVGQYLASGDRLEREQILDRLRGLEGATPEYVARMLPLMTPPLPLPEEARDEDDEWLFHVSAEQTGAPRGEYLVRLPPEYDPLRSYPCLVALHSMAAPPESQIDFWAGPFSETLQMRVGQAARHGFVVVAPAWTRPDQRTYEATPREHGRVLAALRDAMRRVSIDADRVFIVGHGDGGSAAWDIALSHPDLWAGMINIGGDPTFFTRRYSTNAQTVPMRFVFGEIAGSPAPLIRFGDTLDRYMKRDYHALVINYRGRGAEPFYEEIHHHFDWLRLPTLRRSDAPTQIEAVTMRRGDQFFWWLELEELLDNIVVDPFMVDITDRKSSAPVEASVGNNNEVRVRRSPCKSVRVHLEPSMGVRLDQRLTVRSGNRSAVVEFDGSLDQMLEDVRTRADRKRPFWTSVTLP